jgi:hypothetical protein
MVDTVWAVFIGLLLTSTFVLAAWVHHLEGKLIALTEHCNETQRLFHEYEGDMNTLIEWISDNVDVTWEQQQELDAIRLRREGLPHAEYTEGKDSETPVEKTT